MRGIPAAELDRSPPYVVRWMLVASDDEQRDTPQVHIETADDIAAVAQIRGVTPESQQAEALTG